MDKDISTQLQELRIATGWSEPRIAEEIGVSQPTVNRILNGQRECKSSTWRAITLAHQKFCTEALERINDPVEQLPSN